MKKLLLFFFVFSYLSSNAQWVQITSPYPGNLWSVVFTDALHGYAGGNTAILTTTDGGIHWTSANTSSFMINDLSFPTADTGFYGANNTIVGKTVNHAQTWTTIDPGVSPWGVKAVEFVTSSTGYIGTDGGQVLKTTNGGQSWTTQSPGIGISDVHKIHFFDPQTGILCAEGGSIRRTINGGVNWNVVFSNVSGTLYDMFFINSSTGFICAAGGKILKSTDGGATWTTLTSGTTQYLYSICFKDVNEGYAGGANGTLLHTINGGTSWTTVTSSTPEDINDLVYTNGRFIGVCAAGDIITDLVTGIDNASSPVQSVFPNPCTDDLKIQLNKNYRHVTVEVYDANGKYLTDYLFDGASLLHINTTGFTPGIYLCKIVGDGESKTMVRFVVME
jgi:photosystem II stability/assembly factor-like uncharacterized protein